MEQVIGSFISALRNTGVRISVSESLDAVRATGLVGYRKREDLQTPSPRPSPNPSRKKRSSTPASTSIFSFDFFNAPEERPGLSIPK